MIELADTIRLLRHERGLSQEQLAERSGLTADTVRRVEQGRTQGSVTTVERLARGFALPVAALFMPRALHDLATLAGRPHASEIVAMLLRRSDDELAAIETIIRAAFERPAP